MPRQYQPIQTLLAQIKEMLESGTTKREIEKQLWLTGKRPFINCL